jgi:hypothetical protein
MEAWNDEEFEQYIKCLEEPSNVLEKLEENDTSDKKVKDWMSSSILDRPGKDALIPTYSSKEEIENSVEILKSKRIPLKLTQEFDHLFEFLDLPKENLTMWGVFGYVVGFLVSDDGDERVVEEMRSALRNMCKPAFLDNIDSLGNSQSMGLKNLLTTNHHIFHMDVSPDLKSYTSTVGGIVMEEVVRNMMKKMDAESLYQAYIKLKTDDEKYGHLVGGLYELLLEKIIETQVKSNISSLLFGYTVAERMNEIDRLLWKWDESERAFAVVDGDGEGGASAECGCELFEGERVVLPG